MAGLYAAILSTLNAYWRWRDKRSHIRITIRPTAEYIPDGPHAMAEYTPECLHVSVLWQALNCGEKPVTLTYGGFILSRKYLYWFPDSTKSFPHELLPGHEYSIQTTVKVLANDIQEEYGLSGTIRFTGFTTNSIGETFKEGKLRINIASERLEIPNRKLVEKLNRIISITRLYKLSKNYRSLNARTIRLIKHHLKTRRIFQYPEYHSMRHLTRLLIMAMISFIRFHLSQHKKP
jgi:hypothetical protein